MKRKQISLSPELTSSLKHIKTKLVGGKEVEYMERYFPNLQRNKDAISLYESKDKTEKIFTQKIKTVIETDPSLKNMAYSDIINQRYDQFKPEAYVYLDFFLKHPMLLEKAKTTKLPKINQHKIKTSPNEENQYHSRIISFPLSKETKQNNHSTIEHIDQSTFIKKDHVNSNNDNNTKSRNITINDNKSDDHNQITNRIYDFKKYPSQRYVLSDVHNLTNEQTITNRSGEIYLFKPNLNRDKLSFSTSTESVKGWIPKTNTQPTLLNHGSVKYNILTPNYKSHTFTKPELKQLLNEHYYKIGSLSQFVDLTRVSSPNLNHLYMETISAYKTPFNQHSNVCANYSDMHRNYKGLFRKSFWSKTQQ